MLFFFLLLLDHRAAVYALFVLSVHARVLFLHTHTHTDSLICLFLCGISSEIMAEARLPCCVCKPESGGTSDDVGSDLASLPVSFTPVLMLLWRSSCSVSSSPLEKTVNKASLSFSFSSPPLLSVQLFLVECSSPPICC